MEVEGCVDVVTTLQRLREQRPGIFTSQVMKGRSRREEGKRGMKGREERRSKKKRKRRKSGRKGKGDFLLPLFHINNTSVFLAEARCSKYHLRFLYLCRTTSSLHMRFWHLHPLGDEV